MNAAGRATAEHPTEGAHSWDVVVIGTGMGGAALGARLAEAGYSVLFLEKGGWSRGAADPSGGDTAAERRRAGYWPDRVSVEVDGKVSEMLLPLGSGVGGSTNLYSAALERFERSDIESLPGMPHPTGGWPVSWDTWQHFYAEAELRLRVRGLDDDRPGTLLPPITACDLDRNLSARLALNGLSPYPLRVGIAYRPGCTECGGHKCLTRCKSDAETIFIEPALASGKATLYTDAEVIGLEANDTSVHDVVFRQDGALQRVSGRIVVLAAGAYHSPALLLQSANQHWPKGLANRSGLVGRNLMLHANEWLAVWASRNLSGCGPRKTIGFRDHYQVEGVRLGEVQSTGLTATFGNICAFLMGRFAASRWRHVKGVDKLLKLTALIAVRLFGNATIFVMIVEDYGLPDNCVTLDPAHPGRIRISYTVDQDLKRRTHLARRKLKRSFAGLRTMTLQSTVMLNFGHACGTCRFGTDADTSVLDPDCRAHGINNLYVVDGSFMPSSGGANPALTIAANALRVAETLIGHLRAQPQS